MESTTTIVDSRVNKHTRNRVHWYILMSSSAR